MFPRILFPHEAIWFETFRAGFEAQHTNRLEEAVVLLERAVNIAIQQRLSTEQILHTYLAYGLALTDSNKMDEAERVLRRAANFSEQNGRQYKQIHMMLFAELGMLLLARKEFAESRTLFEKSIEIHRKRGIKMDAEFLSVYSALLFCYVSLEELGKAVVFGRKALEASRRLHGERHEKTQAIRLMFEYAASNQDRLEDTVPAN